MSEKTENEKKVEMMEALENAERLEKAKEIETTVKKEEEVKAGKKKYLTKKKVKSLLVTILMTIIGSAMCGLAFNIFIMPNHLLSGGISGIALILNYSMGLDPGLLIILMNIPIFVLGFKKLGKEFMFMSVIGLLTFSLAISSFSFLRNVLHLDDILLSCLFGGVLNGIGMGIVFRARSSSGGLDIIAVIVKKYYSLNIGTTSMIVNFFIIAIGSTFLGIKPALYTLVCMYVGSVVLERVQEGFNTGKAIMVVSDSWEEVASGIIEEVGRGVTYLDGEGAFSKQKRRVVYCVVTMSQLAKVKKLVKDIDPKAFMTVSETTEVLGRGFKKKGI